ncbi:hypothetical protein [Glutamicibacter arilaitensis]|uniref:hypothetical protein n=1 Tax=Glutamicibacter arilaitensis TaxID=256701 RepID=UPI003FD5AC6F
MATIHNIELDLFARTAHGEEINLGKVQVPIKIDVNPQRQALVRPAAMRANLNTSKPITPEEFDNLGGATPRASHNGGNRP